MPEPLIFGCRSMDTDRCPFSDTFRRASRPAPGDPLLKKGSIRKLFLWASNILFLEKERTWNAGTMDFREPIYGYRASSLCGCFVLSCMVGGIFRKPLGFRRCLPPARPEKAWPFQAGRSPCTKHPQDCPALPLRPEKSFLGFQGAFFQKRTLWQGVGQGPTKREGEPAIGVRLFRRDKVLSRNAHRPSGFAFTNLKKFLRVPRGVFQKRSLAGSGTEAHKERANRLNQVKSLNSAGCAHRLFLISLFCAGAA